MGYFFGSRVGTQVLPHSAVHGLPVMIASVTAEAGTTICDIRSRSSTLNSSALVISRIST